MDDVQSLAPPGAGVPFPQVLWMRYVLRPFAAHTTPWERSEARFRVLTARIERELGGLTDEQLAKRVLIAPMPGLEDSSRNWSIAMTLDHIQIVGRRVSQLVLALSEGVVPDEKADTAAVKPRGLNTVAEDLANFRDFCGAEFPKLLRSVRNRKSRTRFAHPWFGPMTAQGWYWLLATHHGVHLRQIRRIRQARR